MGASGPVGCYPAKSYRYWLSAFVHLGYRSHRHRCTTAPLGIKLPKGLRFAGGYSLRVCHAPCSLRD